METVVIRTTGKPASLKAKADAEVFRVGSVAHIDISTLDENGLHVPAAVNKVRVLIEGNGFLKGMDNVDLTDKTIPACAKRDMFSGWLMAMIYADRPGAIKVTIQCDGIENRVICPKAE